MREKSLGNAAIKYKCDPRGPRQMPAFPTLNGDPDHTY